VLKSKERILYIISLIFLASILGYFLFGGDEDYVDNYNSQINDLENKIDSLHGINSTLNIKIEGLNDQISTLDKELDLQDTKIVGLKKKVNEKIISIDFLNDDELELFFTDRYKRQLDSIRKDSSKIRY
jgi:chromosome segregation ATPase|tara:strand:- start:457 stop:843 length:387 start_codon:yes stop_codon:yes gene_type:complete